MKISSVKFVISAASTKQFPEQDWPEIAFAGKSNVGKSSLINMLLSRKKLVKVSSRPGKTQQINFFNLNDSFHLVDLPGYGFANVPIKVRQAWEKLIVKYIESRNQLAACALLLDIRRKVTNEDLAVVDLFRQNGLPSFIVITKSDKLSLQQRKKQISSIAKSLHLEPGDLFVTSAVKGWQKEELWNALETFITKDEEEM